MIQNKWTISSSSSSSIALRRTGSPGELVPYSSTPQTIPKMHIHPSSPNSSQSEDDAATKIQAGFRGYRVRKQMRQGGSKGGVANAVGGTAGSANGGGPSGVGIAPGTEEDRSATKIQANVRGFLVRKKQKMATEAATKIQASFRGFKTRKELKSIKKDK
uniref:Myosin motor domain-containing protein n=1 Tax=Anopheles atroparvus TaxID=41427 RepID=A0A182JHV1_ANOAO